MSFFRAVDQPNSRLRRLHTGIGSGLKSGLARTSRHGRHNDCEWGVQRNTASAVRCRVFSLFPSSRRHIYLMHVCCIAYSYRGYSKTRLNTDLYRRRGKPMRCLQHVGDIELGNKFKQLLNSSMHSLDQYVLIVQETGKKFLLQ